MTAGILAFVAAGALAASVCAGNRLPRAWLALTLAGLACTAGAAARVLTTDEPWEWYSTFPLGGSPLHLRIDGLSAVFLLLVSAVGAAGAVYSRGYWPDRHRGVSAGRGRLWWSALVFNLAAVLVLSNGLHFLIAWELFALCAFFLITLERDRREVRAAGWLYLAASHAGTLCLFAFFALLAARTGSWDLGPQREHPELAPLFWLALLGFGVKAGVFPLHVWLPSAHANAPSHVSAILSGVAIKMGIYGLMRFSGWLPTPTAAGWVLLGLGAASALLGIAFALAQNDLKRLLAYSSVENIGVILTGLGAALLGVAEGDTAWGRLAFAGALLHVCNHCLFKSLLFLCAGSVLHATGTREMSRLGGLWRAMPWTASLFGVGAMAVSALPPLNGFVSEWLVYLGLFEAAHAPGPVAWAALLAALVLAVTGALALATFVKAGAIVFVGAPRTKLAPPAHECDGWMRAPMVALALGCMIAGVAPLLLWQAVAPAMSAWHPAWTGTETLAPLAALGGAQIALAVLLGCAVAGVRQIVRSRGVRAAPTWDCGYAAPAARMQYTSGAMAGIATRWFSFALQPERTLRRPRGVFPDESTAAERTPETVLERILEPAARAVLAVSTFVRRLQHGRLQFYIAYVVAGLGGLGAIVLWEGIR